MEGMVEITLVSYHLGIKRIEIESESKNCFN